MLTMFRKDIYVSGVGLDVLLDKQLRVTCPGCEADLKSMEIQHSPACKYAAYRKNEFVPENVRETLMSEVTINDSDENFKDAMERSAEIGGYKRIQKEIRSKFEYVYLFVSNTIKGIIASTLFKRYLESQNNHVQLIFPETLESTTNSTSIFNPGEVENAVIQLIRIIKRHMKARVCINLTAGDRSFVPYLLYVSSWSQDVDKFEIRGYMIQEQEEKPLLWAPFPILKLNAAARYELFRAMEIFWENECFVSVPKKLYRKETGDLIREWMKDNVIETGDTISLNMRGRLLFELLQLE